MVIYSEELIKKDITDVRMNISTILKDIEENCSQLLAKHPNIKKLPMILPTCWRAHDYYRHARLVICFLIIHDSFAAYLVSGGPLAYLCASTIIGLLGIFAVYNSKLGLLLLFDFGYIAFGFIVVAILLKKCFIALPLESLYTSWEPFFNSLSSMKSFCIVTSFFSLWSENFALLKDFSCEESFLWRWFGRICSCFFALTNWEIKEKRFV